MAFFNMTDRQIIGALLVLFIQVYFFVAFGKADTVPGVSTVAAVTDISTKGDPITIPTTTISAPSATTLNTTTPTPATTSTSSSTTTTTTKTTTTAPPTNTTTTTPAPNTTTAVPSTTTTTTKAPPTPPPSRHFDMPSFIGGIVLTLGLIGIGFVGHKIYKSKFDRNYHTL